MRTALLIAGTMVMLFIESPAVGLDFRLHENNSPNLTAVLAAGTVQSDDADRLDRFLSLQPRKRNTAVYLNSPGGSLSGGIRLGEYFKQKRIKTVVEGNETCASACALAFLGGTDAKGTRWMSSTTTSRLGVHAFRNADGTRYDDTNDTQRTVGAILRYGKMVDAPMEILIRNFQTPSDDMYWFTTNELLSLGVKVWDMANKCFVGGKNC